MRQWRVCVCDGWMVLFSRGQSECMAVWKLCGLRLVIAARSDLKLAAFDVYIYI